MTHRRRRHAVAVLPLAAVCAFASPAAAGASTGARAALAACPSAAASPAAVTPARLEHSVLCLLNRERTRRGLRRLRTNRRLARAARRHSRHMVRRRFFSHVSPGGSTMMSRTRSVGYGGRTLGENIAWGSGSYATPIEIVEGWMESPGHRENILRRSFREVGVGVAPGAPASIGGGSAATYTTNFGARL